MATTVGKIIRILDEYTIIINTGMRDVSVGDKLQIYEKGDDILDLDGTLLDQYIYIKDEVEVIRVENNYSICKKKKTINKSATFTFALSPLLEFNSTESVPLNIDKNDLQPFPSIDPIIRIGDKIRLKQTIPAHTNDETNTLDKK